MVFALGLLDVLIALGGCATATHKVASFWRYNIIVADGNDIEWTVPPQYYDPDRRIAIRVANGTTAISLCIAASEADLKRQLQMTGLDVWFDPQGGQKHVFGLHLPGANAKMSDHASPPDSPMSRPRDGRGRPPDDQPPIFEPLKELAVSYADATGPLNMKISEVRRTGIDIGVRQGKGGRLVYEFNIALKAAPSLSDLKPGMVVGIGFLCGKSAQGVPKGGPSGGSMGLNIAGGMGGPRPGGGMGGGPEGGGFRMKGNLLDVWLQVRMAQTPVG